MLDIDVRKQRGAFAAQVTFTSATPGVTALFGRSGSGKTTLINIISGLLRADAGVVRLGDQTLTDTPAGIAVPVERRRIGYVFQDARLFPHLTVAGNLAYGKRRARSIAPFIGFDEVVTLLGLAALLPRRPRQLSGGERQRVSLGRALLSQPRLLLLDEPLAALDRPHRARVSAAIAAFIRERDVPLVLVSHDERDVAALADEVWRMEAGRLAPATADPGRDSAT